MSIGFCNCFFLISAFMAVLIGSSHSLTLSSKLIHRFSDEANGFRVSKNGSFPTKKSLDYFKLLMRNDLQRQRMNLGAQYKSLIFSEGGETVALGNDFGWLHYTWIEIGTPKISYLVALDVGSDLSWVPCDCIQCAPLPTSHYYGLGRDLNIYSPARSNTSKNISCSNTLCDLGPYCKSQKQPCPYIVNYLTENTSSSGFLVEDTLYLAPGRDLASASSVQASVIIGCGRKQSGGVLTGSAPDGLLGLGFGDISVPSFLAKAGLVRNSFSMCFKENDSGRIFFGDQGVSTQQSTPFLASGGKYLAYIVGVESFCVGTACQRQTGLQMMFDSGSSFTYLQDDVYKQVAMEFDRQMKASRITYEGSPWEYCYKDRASELPEIPNVKFVFAENKSFEVQSPVFVFNDSEVELNVICLALQPAEDPIGIIGQNFMSGYRIVYDRENMKLGWSPSDCRDEENENERSRPPTSPARGSPENPLPTNEQQSSSPGHAVSPAIAGRTPLADRSVAYTDFASRSYLLLLLLLLLVFVS